MTPLQLSDDEMTVLLALAGPIEQHLRPQFLEAVAAELEVKRQAGEIGEGAVHRAREDHPASIFRPAATGPDRARAAAGDRLSPSARLGAYGAAGDRKGRHGRLWAGK